MSDAFLIVGAVDVIILVALARLTSIKINAGGLQFVFTTRDSTLARDTMILKVLESTMDLLLYADERIGCPLSKPNQIGGKLIQDFNSFDVYLVRHT